MVVHEEATGPGIEGCAQRSWTRWPPTAACAATWPGALWQGWNRAVSSRIDRPAGVEQQDRHAGLAQLLRDPAAGGPAPTTSASWSVTSAGLLDGRDDRLGHLLHLLVRQVRAHVHVHRATQEVQRPGARPPGRRPLG